ncbi:hypothetical protein [Dactylosporangium sp. NPDC005555]|uniref:hypothetical protein n=1 Tax=Dactylosporangium sp. NPDC005555 TaxID=3154889 RepID=UPI0033AB2955
MDEPAGVIDLDDVREDRPGAMLRWRRAARRAVPLPGVVVLVLLAAAVGAGVAQRWEAARQRERQAAAVSLFVAVAGANSGAGDGERVTIEGSVAVVNGGPRAVEVAGAGVVADVMVWGEHRIAPGARAWFTVSATITCAEDAGSRPLPVGLSAVTADGVRRPVTAAIEVGGSSWSELVRRGCGLSV